MAKKNDITADLFGTATKVVKKTAKSDDKEVILVDSIEVANAIDVYVAAKKVIEAEGAKKDAAEAIIKNYGKTRFVKIVEETGKKPESCILSNNNNNSMLYIVQDAYKKIDDERFEYLQQTYGDIVDTDTVFTINPEMIQKYGKEISAAIMGCKNIPADDKMKIIQKTETVRIKKGTIERLRDVAKAAKTTVLAVFEEILPTQALKPRNQK